MVNSVLRNLNIYEYFIHFLILNLSFFGAVIFLFCQYKMWGEIPELHYLRILTLPICLTFFPGPFAFEAFISETWEPLRLYIQ